MATYTIVVLSVLTALLAVGLLSTMTVLFTLCDEVINGKNRKPVMDLVKDVTTPPWFFLPFSGVARDTFVNGTQSEWMSVEDDYVFLGTIKRGRLLLQVNTTGGFIILRLVELLSVGVQDHITFYINSGSTGFKTTRSNQYVWVRIIEDEEDKKKINCTAGDGFRTDWAFVATWIGYEGSTFQIVFAFQRGSTSLVFFN